MALPYKVVMVSVAANDGTKEVAEYSSHEYAETQADSLAQWMHSKSIPGSVRVVHNSQIIYSVNAGREGVPVNESSSSSEANPVPITELLQRASHALGLDD